MKLKMEEVQIKAVEFGETTCIKDHILYVNQQELRELLEKDKNFSSVNIVIARPGDSTRIVNVVDVAEPRCKISGGDDFPGVISRTASAGRGVTRALKGVTVVFCDRHPHWVHSKSIIDMFGCGGELGGYGNKLNVVIDPVPAEEVEDFEYAHSVKVAGLKAAVYLAKAAKEDDVDNIEVYDLEATEMKESNLPKVAYYYQIYSPQHDAKGVPDPVFYGTPISRTLPIVVHPNEILDGGVLSGTTIRMMESYSIQNHPIIKELYKRHGKELNFVGVVLAVSSMEAERRPLNAAMVGTLVSDILGADGLIMTKPLGGAPNVDLGEAAVECEARGVKTCMIIQILTTETFLNTEAMFNSPSLNAIINNGAIFDRIRLSAPDTVLGGTSSTPIYDDRNKQTAIEEIELEQRFLCGRLNQIGASKVAAIQY